MAKILIPQKDLQFEADPKSTLMQNLLRHQLPVASSCGGEAICGKCKVQVQRGLESLPPASELELRTHKRHRLQNNERLSCQIYPTSDLTIQTPYW